MFCIYKYPFNIFFHEYLGSIVGSRGNSGQCVYSASKSGLVGFTKSLAKEVASRGIRVNLIVPGDNNI